MIGRLLGRQGDGGGAGVASEWHEALKVVLKRLDAGPASISGAAESYVLTGEPASALAMVIGSAEAPEAFRLWSTRTRVDVEVADRQVWQGLGSVPPEVLLRFARLMEGVQRAGNPNYFSLHAVGGAPLAEALLGYLIGIGGGASHAVMASLPLDHAAIEAMLESAGADPSDLLVAAFRENPSWSARNSRDAVRLLNGFGAAVGRHAEVLRPMLGTRNFDQQLVALEMLAEVGADDLTVFARELAELATSSSSQLRAKATPLVVKLDAVEPLKSIATTGKPDERLRALQLLWPDAEPALREWLREVAAADRAPKVSALLTEWGRAGIAPEQPVAIIEKPVIDWAVPLDDELAASLQAQWKTLRGWQPQHHQDRSRLPDAVDLTSLFEELRAGRRPKLSGPRETRSGQILWNSLHYGGGFDFSELGLAGTTIMLNHFGVLLDHSRSLSSLATRAYNSLYSRTGKPSLLEVSAVLDELGLDGPTQVFEHYCRSWDVEFGRSWAAEDVAPFVQSNLKLVTDVISGPSTWWNHDDKMPYQALATLPELPPAVVDVLVGVALGSRKTAREPAQNVLAAVPGISERGAAGLKDGKAEIRTAAAQWLARLGDPSVVPALEAAVLREKNDVPKGALLDALESFGFGVEKYLNRDEMAKDAAAALRKGIPKELNWLAWELVPQVRWAETGESVPGDILRWFVILAVKAKSPEPNAILRKYCSMLDPVDREVFGQYLLEAWLAEDVRTATPEEARALALRDAAGLHRHMTQYPRAYVNNPMQGKTLEELAEEYYLAGHLGRPAGSVAGAKGLLALVALCARERAAEPVGRYLKEWYGQRAVQGKALIAMLGWIDHPSATQLMLSIGSRFRTKSFQEEATKQAEALAERRGWSLNELADRTIPTAGFGDDGVIELSYGERVFTAVLRLDLSIELRAPDGKKISSLPAARQSEDPDVVKAAKKSLTLAKKELKAIVQLQSQRLYEALCTERTWAFDDWQTYLNLHPVVRYLTQRLAWVADGATVFRPLDDGTLTDVDDNELKLPADAVIAIAHDSLLDPEVVQAWQEHLVDYEVSSLFQQFGKGTFVLPEKAATEYAVLDFEGHLLEAFALRGRAGKLGYTRGEAQDAGWFYEYEKRFPTLGMTAVVAFTGNPLPEENRVVALNSLTFVRSVPGGGPAAGVMLGEVPAVLLSEAYNDLRLMASDGTGFDPDWKKKSEY
ncbi:DUF4132 domain-containing protein [Kribbella sp. NPDC051620]|uniref:DUF4132 domain-containing protein n=1 Tax=Kribbella sp. NPDC051620 TaxID=3364120 RepID=UPI0037AFD6F8